MLPLTQHVNEADEEMGSSSKPRFCVRPGPPCFFGALVVLLLLSWACIAVLFYLYTTIDTRTPSSATTATLTMASAVSPQRVVSMDSQGRAVQGAGRSIFKNVTAMNTICPKYIDIDAVFANSFLASYQNSATGESTLKVVTIDPSSGATTVTTTNTAASFYLVATLNQDSGLFIGISQTFFANESFVTAGVVNSASDVVSLGQSSLYGCYLYGSANPYITRLSNTSFAISHFCSNADYKVTTLNTQYGVVDPVTLEVTLGPSIVYAGATLGNSSHHGIVGLDDLNYFVMYQDYSLNLPLSAIKVTVQPSNLSVAFTQPYPLNGEQLNYYSFFDTAR